MSIVTVDEFKSRLEALCAKKGGRGLPKKRRDQQILFKSIMLLLDPATEYTETELNQRLENWLAEVGQTVELDHVSLRRHLVDEGYLNRDKAGVTYRVSVEGMAGLFDPAIDKLDPAAVLEEARQRRELKKREYLNK